MPRKPASRRQQGFSPVRAPRNGAGRAGPSNATAISRAINVTPTTRRVLRWTGTVTSTASLIVTRACLLSAIVANPGTIAGSVATTLIPIYESVRVRQVRLVLPPGTQTGTTAPAIEVALEWSSFLGKDVKHSQVVMNNLGASFAVRPPSGTRAAMWGSSNTSAAATQSINEVLFTVMHDPTFTATATTVPLVVEIDLDFVQANDTTAVIAVVTAAQVNASNAGVYQCPLDIITPGAILGARRFDPLGIQDVRIDSTGAAITYSSLVRTN